MVQPRPIDQRLLSPRSSSRAREIAEEILYPGPRIGHGAPLALGWIVRARTLRVPEPLRREGRIVQEPSSGPRLRIGSDARELERGRQTGDDGATPVGERAQKPFAPLGPGVVEDGDGESPVALTAHGDAALEQVFACGAHLRVAVHRFGLVGEVEGRRGFGRHMELERIVDTVSRLGAVFGFAVGKSMIGWLVVPRPRGRL